MFPDRIKRVEESIKEEVGHILQMEMKDPRVKWTTVQNVIVSRDLRYARIYVSVLTGNDDEDEQADIVVETLNGAAGFIKHLLGERIRMKFMPELRFFKDTTPAVAQRIGQLYDEARRQSQASATDSEPSGSGSDVNSGNDTPGDGA